MKPKKILLSAIALAFVSMALYSLVAGQANQNNFPQGFINANSGNAGAIAFFSANGGSSTVSPDTNLTDASNQLNYAGSSGILASGGTLSSGTNGATGGTVTLFGSTSGSATLSTNSSGTALISGPNFTVPKINTSTNCAQGGASGTTSPAACGAASSGAVAIPASQTTYTVNTTAASANSHIIVQQIQDNATIATATCNSGATTPILTSRSAGASFTIALTSVASVTCIQYWIVN